MPVVHGVRGRQFRAHRGSVPLAMVVLLGGFLGLGAATLAAPPAGAGTALGWVTTAALPGWADVASEGSIYPLANVQIHCSTKSLCVGLMPANPSASDNPNGYLDGAIYTSNGGAGWSAVTIGIAGGNYPPNSSTPVAMSCPVSGKSLQCLVLAEGSTGATDFESSTSGQSLDWQAADMYQQTSEPENPDAPYFVTDASCPTISTCQWVGDSSVYNQGLYDGDPGYTFTGPPLGPWSTYDANLEIPDYASNFVDESCIAGGVCFITGQSCATSCDFLATPTLFSQDGSTWTYKTNFPDDTQGVHSGDAFQGIGAVTCVPGKVATDPSDATCYVALNDGGQGAGEDGKGYAPGIAKTTNGGATWSVVSEAAWDGLSIAGFTCATKTVCFAFGAVGVPDGGTNTSSEGEVLLTINGGLTWTQEGLPDNTLSADSITCAGSADCFAGAETTSGYAVYKTIDTGSPDGTPSQPSDLVAKPAGTGATLKWKPSFAFGSPVTSYAVQVNNLTTDTSTDAPSVTTTSTTVSNLTAGDSYNFYVYAVNARGQGIEAASNVIVAP
jgi:hypothetical protein